MAENFSTDMVYLKGWAARPDTRPPCETKTVLLLKQHYRPDVSRPRHLW